MANFGKFRPVQTITNTSLVTWFSLCHKCEINKIWQNQYTANTE